MTHKGTAAVAVTCLCYRRLIACFFGPLQETIASFYGPYRLTFSAKSSILELNYGFSEHERKNGGDVFPKSMI